MQHSEASTPTDSLTQNLPETLKNLRSRPLFIMRLDVRPLQLVGATPQGFRRVGVVPGGIFEGERLSGVVLDPLFETAAAKYDWLNRIVAVGIGHRRADGPVYSIFEVL